MTNHNQAPTQYDEWLTDDSAHAALVMREWLVPIEGTDAVIFPPTYAPPEEKRKEDWPGYNIDRLENGTKVCQIDSVGSQANRMEPIFKRPPYSELVPQVIVTAGTRQVHLLDAGHRAADAIVRFTDLGTALWDAFRALLDRGDAETLARIAPTSLVFGVWDSRATQAKVPRIVRSVIRAYNIREFHRSAQYSTIAGEILEGGEAEVTTKGPKAELGLAHVPAAFTHGGIQVLDEIRRDAALSFVSLRTLRSTSQTAEDDLKLRRYILGLALISFTAPQEIALRQGCELVPNPEKTRQCQIVRVDGNRDLFLLTHQEALAYARDAARAFEIRESVSGTFNSEVAQELLKLPEKERKAALRSGPVTVDSLKKSRTKAAKKSNAAPTTEESQSEQQ